VSGVRCSQCHHEIPRAELCICELCQRGFCVQCMPAHGCSTDLMTELNPLLRETHGNTSNNAGR
jgi:hypothetical protein